MCAGTYIAATQPDQTSWIVFVGIANKCHGNTYSSNEQGGQHACSVHLQHACVQCMYNMLVFKN